MTGNKFSDGTQCIIKPLKPNGDGWTELPFDQRYSLGFPGRAFFFKARGLAVISAVEVATDKDQIERGFEYHLSVSRQTIIGTSRCDSEDAKWVLGQFGLEGAEEDNHVPFGKVRNFWRPVASPLVGLECKCKESEPAIIEDKGDYIWRGTP